MTKLFYARVPYHNFCTGKVSNQATKVNNLDALRPGTLVLDAETKNASIVNQSLLGVQIFTIAIMALVA